MDIGSISAALVSIKTATDIARLIKDSDVSLEKAESKLKLAELISALADVKIQIADVQQFLIEKDAELRAVREQLLVKENLHWESPYYWSTDAGKKDGPFCQRCYDKDHALIRLQRLETGVWVCKVCNNNYTDKDYRESGAFVIEDQDI
jgi:hypothetical protein